MKLTEIPEIVNWSVTHYVFVEKVGPFQETAQKAWEQFHKNLPDISKGSKVSGFMALYKMQPQMIYRAGAAVDSQPENLAPDLKYIKFEGGKYSKFVLTGSYKNLPEACGKVFDMVKQLKISVRDNFYIENYANDPKTTPEDQLITEILIPTN